MPQNTNPHSIFAAYFRDLEALAYGISTRLEQGHICLDIEEYLEEPDLQESNPFFEDREGFLNMTAEGLFVTHSDREVKPFVIRNGKAYLHRYFRYEQKIRDNIKRLGDHFHIITGGPGTGKTYGVATRLLEVYKERGNVSVALAAPTGKATTRINEALRDYAAREENKVPEEIKQRFDGLKAQTLHRLLGTLPDSALFRFNEHNRLPYDIIIVDECSMIDGAMMAKLLDAVDDNSGLFLLGDKDQLASVEAGSIFGDLCRMKDSELLKGKIEIKVKSWRFDVDKGIGRFSREVIDGKLSELSAFEDDEQLTIDTTFSSHLFREQALLYKNYIEDRDIAGALRKMNAVRFLCVTRENENSVSDTNDRIEKILQKEFRGTDLFEPRRGFYHNQPIIVTKNDYSLNVFNGEVGLIRKEGDILFAYFEDSEKGVKRIQAGYLNHYDTVFAMTIHKSQGSEFSNVVVILPERQGEKLLTRELLYTGITRAREFALLQASREILQKCAEREVSRSSGLANQFTES